MTRRRLRSTTWTGRKGKQIPFAPKGPLQETVKADGLWLFLGGIDLHLHSFIIIFFG